MCTYPTRHDIRAPRAVGSTPAPASSARSVRTAPLPRHVRPTPIEPHKRELDLLRLWVDLRCSFGKVCAPREVTRVQVHSDRPLHDPQVRGVKGVSISNGPLFVGEIQCELPRVLVRQGQGCFRCRLACIARIISRHLRLRLSMSSGSSQIVSPSCPRYPGEVPSIVLRLEDPSEEIDGLVERVQRRGRVVVGPEAIDCLLRVAA